MGRILVSYSLSHETVFFVPCLPFTGSTSRRDQFRPCKGNSFALKGFNTWKKQTDKTSAQEKSNTYKEAKAAPVLFQQSIKVESLILEQKIASKTK